PPSISTLFPYTTLFRSGHRLARNGHQIRLGKVVVECWSAPMSWGEVWRHQLRWARTIRVCQPVAYFFSVLSNPTFWPLLWALTKDRKSTRLNSSHDQIS